MKRDQFIALAVEHLDALHRYAHRLSGHVEEAEDLVQGSFERALANLNSFREPEAVRPVMFRILHNHFINRWRSKSRGPLVVPLESPEGQSWEPICNRGTPASVLMSAGISDEVDRALGEIGDTWRETLWLKSVEGFSYEEIAEITEVPIGTVRSRLARARRLLAKRLQTYAAEQGLISDASERKGA